MAVGHDVYDKLVPDEDPNRRYDVPGSDNSLWAQILARLQPYLSSDLYGQIAGAQSQLSPLVNAAVGAWGQQGVLNALGYNPKKGAYTALSYLTGKPYYDRTGEGKRGRLFYVPGYKPNYGAGVEDEIDYDPSRTDVWWT